jgi:hypothetical protein
MLCYVTFGYVWVFFHFVTFRFVSCGFLCLQMLRFVKFHYVMPRSHVPVFDLPGADQTGDSTNWNCITSPVLTCRSNDQERCDEAVVHAQ